jgi:hypothetical protein
MSLFQYYWGQVLERGNYRELWIAVSDGLIARSDREITNFLVTKYGQYSRSLSAGKTYQI